MLNVFTYLAVVSSNSGSSSAIYSISEKQKSDNLHRKNWAIKKKSPESNKIIYLTDCRLKNGPRNRKFTEYNKHLKIGILRRTSLMSSFLLHQRCTTCLVHFTLFLRWEVGDCTAAV